MRVGQRNLILLIVGVAGIFSLTAATRRSTAEPADAREIARLRTHFDVVLEELRSADAARWTPPQRSARATLIARLEQYSAAGRFPHNHVVPGSRVPVFRDEHQTLCAMGYLIASTGRSDIVDDVARLHNRAYITELASDARLTAWLDSSGLTLAEAARIQPAYEDVQPSPTRVNATWSPEYYAASMLATTLSGASIAVNLLPRAGSVRHARRDALLGFMAGASQLALGAFVIDRHGVTGAVGAANMLLGGTAAGTSLWRMRNPPRPTVAARSVSLLPFVTGNHAVGVRLSARL